VDEQSLPADPMNQRPGSPPPADALGIREKQTGALTDILVGSGLAEFGVTTEMFMDFTKEQLEALERAYREHAEDGDDVRFRRAVEAAVRLKPPA
jgi:hypothetical protein